MKKPKISFVMCHQMPERSFHFQGKQFPICARCTGILIGYLTLPFFHYEMPYPSILLIILLIIPMLIDSITQTMGLRESNNPLRFITGFLAGAGQVALIVLVGKTLLNVIY